MFLTDIHSLGLKTAQGLTITSAWYRDKDDASRAFAKRFMARNPNGLPNAQQRYAIRDLDQARRYLADSVLGKRSRRAVCAAMVGPQRQVGIRNPCAPDNLKFRSWLTLFSQAASENSDHMLFTEALDQFYGGEPDPRTLDLLGSKR